MSDEQAQCEAKRRWGPAGAAWFDDRGYQVGMSGEEVTFGKGNSWEAAFADATKNGH